MKFWDSSALVPLLALEPSTRPVTTLYLQDLEVVVWWATPVECASAIARLERDDALLPTEASAAFERLDVLAASWLQIEPSD